MPGATFVPSYICRRCLRTPQQSLRSYLAQSSRWLSSSPPSRPADAEQHQHTDGDDKGEKSGAMSRRLAELTEESLVSGGRRAQKTATEEAGFSEELRKQLEERIANANFRNQYASAIAQSELPASAGRGTRDIAAAAPWSGTESVEDAALRMLNDSIKPIRVKPRTPGVRVPPKVDTGRTRTKASSGVRLANARDKTSIYSTLKDSSLSDEEREKFRREMQERFQPHARAVPMTIRGLESLANERIEDAIARGQFRNIPRGQKLERDYNASNPFLDTTEYFMNKIIQKQEIVPPWIEKQQELVSAATRFRARLRNDWKRHAARMIASKGGTLETQTQRAQRYAEAEKIFNPKKVKEERLNAVDGAGHLSQITLAGELKPTPVLKNGEESERITVTATPVSPDAGTPTAAEPVAEVAVEQSAQPDSPSIIAASHPFRDPTWEQTENSFLSLSITQLNNLTRSYNLMAPDLAKKPYFSLERELKACFADVAPQLADAIRERALMPKAKGPEQMGHRKGGVLERFSTPDARVYDERRQQYGFKEFWRDLFGGKEGGRGDS